MNINYENNKLNIGNIQIDFVNKIKEIYTLLDKIIVLLEIPQADKETIDNIYAVSFNGDVYKRQHIHQSKLRNLQRQMG